MVTRIIDYESWRVREPKGLDAGEYWSKESHVHTVVSRLETGFGFEFHFRDIRTLRRIVHITNNYLKNEANPDSKDRDKRYVQKVDEAKSSYEIIRTR